MNVSIFIAFMIGANVGAGIIVLVISLLLANDVRGKE